MDAADCVVGNRRLSARMAWDWGIDTFMSRGQVSTSINKDAHWKPPLARISAVEPAKSWVVSYPALASAETVERGRGSVDIGRWLPITVPQTRGYDWVWVYNPVLDIVASCLLLSFSFISLHHLTHSNNSYNRHCCEILQRWPSESLWPLQPIPFSSSIAKPIRFKSIIFRITVSTETRCWLQRLKICTI